MLRELMQGSIDNPKAPISNNWRPSMPANYRPVRTNINFDSTVRLAYQLSWIAFAAQVIQPIPIRISL